MVSKSITLTWSLSTISGYGIYGLQLAMQFLRRGGEQFVSTQLPGPCILPTLSQMRLAPTLNLAQKIGEVMTKDQKETLDFDHTVLYAVGNNCLGYAGQERIRGKKNIGCAAIEHAQFTQEATDYARHYDTLIAISHWNESFLKQLDVAPVHLCHQGIDTSLFMPGPKTNLWGDRFVIFSGGKFEFRKGQDIVVEAFKHFHEKHNDAMLVTCWQNPHTQDIKPFQLAGHCKDLPNYIEGQGLQIGKWLIEQGLPIGSFVEIPYTPNMLMPNILRECDAAIFPNRCEGGTNLVAMEAAACGVPTVVSNNTGQKDLVDLLDFQTFEKQSPVKVPHDFACTDDWGETDVDEIIEALEKLYTNHKQARQEALSLAERIKAWDWAPQNEKLLRLCD